MQCAIQIYSLVEWGVAMHMKDMLFQSISLKSNSFSSLWFALSPLTDHGPCSSLALILSAILLVILLAILDFCKNHKYIHIAISFHQKDMQWQMTLLFHTILIQGLHLKGHF